MGTNSECSVSEANYLRCNWHPSVALDNAAHHMGIIVKSDHLLSLSGRVQEAFCFSAHAFLCESAKKRPELIPTEVTSLFV